MDLSDYNRKMPGVVDGVLYGQYNRLDEINERILSRDQPDQALAPNFDPRPAMTKYSIFPMLDARMPATVPIQPKYNYSAKNNFAPPLMKVGPINGYFNNIDTEMQLRNQFFALQKGADQSSYIPSTSSDLYKVYVPSAPSDQPFPGLFATPTFDTSQHRNISAAPTVGRDTFNNNTRTQLRNTSTI